MRLRLLCLAPALFAVACGGGDDTGGGATPTIVSIEPDFGPLPGGKRVVITGSGFLNGGAPPNRVVIGNREALQAGVIDDETLEVVIPEADSPGEVDVVVFNDNGFSMAAAAFRYSAEPAIESVSPAEVPYDSTGATITVSGSGFSDEDAGVTTVLIDGEPALDVEVTSDTTLTFTAPPGVIGTSPDILVVNDRGDGDDDDAFRYSDSGSGALIMVPITRTSEFWATVYDIGNDEFVKIPKLNRGGGGDEGAFRAWGRVGGVLYGLHRDGSWVELDFENQRETTGGGGSGLRYPNMVAIGDTLYSYNVDGGNFGTVNVDTGAQTVILGSPTWVCCRNFIAANSGGSMFAITASGQVVSVNPTTGVQGTPVALSSNPHFTGARFVGNTLYAVTKTGEIVTINTTSGAVTSVATDGTFQVSDLEVFE
jgi:hypothetical protein